MATKAHPQHNIKRHCSDTGHIPSCPINFHLTRDISRQKNRARILS
jgi:hypothetical protein